jgi:two-component system cell cycle response regulator DivK
MNDGNNRARVLIVDDYPDGREMLSEYLAFLGFPVIAARDGTEAIDLATSWGPAVILLDLQMPGMDGWEVTRRLKSQATTRHIIIVALTARALLREVDAARRAGCDAVVAKPYQLAALADALARVTEAGPSAFEAPELGAPKANG